MGAGVLGSFTRSSHSGLSVLFIELGARVGKKEKMSFSGVGVGVREMGEGGPKVHTPSPKFWDVMNRVNDYS